MRFVLIERLPFPGRYVAWTRWVRENGALLRLMLVPYMELARDATARPVELSWF